MMPIKHCFILSKLVSKRVASYAILIVLCIAGFYVARFVYVAVLFSSIIGSHNIIKDSIANGIGDEVGAISELSEHLEDPIKTTVWLKLAHHWFSKTLLTAESEGVAWGATWLNHHELEVTLSFDCIVYVTDPVSNVGDIRIIYHVTSKDPSLGTCTTRGQRRSKPS